MVEAVVGRTPIEEFIGGDGLLPLQLAAEIVETLVVLLADLDGRHWLREHLDLILLIDDVEIVIPGLDDIGLVGIFSGTVLLEGVHLEGLGSLGLLDLLQAVVIAVELLDLVLQLFYLAQIPILLLLEQILLELVEFLLLLDLALQPAQHLLVLVDDVLELLLLLLFLPAQPGLGEARVLGDGLAGDGVVVHRLELLAVQDAFETRLLLRHFLLLVLEEVVDGSAPVRDGDVGRPY